MTTTEHLVCEECSQRVGVARVDRSAWFVCDCTHDDGDLDRVHVREFGNAPLRWRWSE